MRTRVRKFEEQRQLGNRLKMGVCEIQESYLEKKLKDGVLKCGGQALKFISPGKRGVPDRLILKPGGQALFVEMKAPGKPLEPLQRKRADQLRDLGFRVYKIDSAEDVVKFIQEEFNSDI